MYYDELNSNETDWQAVVNELSRIRDSGEYTTSDVDLVREMLTSEDERIRGAACLAAAGCLFEPNILDLMTEIAEYDPVTAIRKASIKSMGEVISEGIEQGFEDDAGSNNQLDYAEEWDEYQSGSLRDEYQRVKNLLFGILDFEEDPGIIEITVTALAELGYISEIREKISELYDGDSTSGKLAAMRAMGKFPHFWETEIAETIRPETPPDVLKEAISAGFSSGSRQISDAIEEVLNHEDPEIIRFALLSLGNIDLSPNLMQIFRQFRKHPDKGVQEAAQQGLDRLSRLNFGDFMRESLGYED